MSNNKINPYEFITIVRDQHPELCVEYLIKVAEVFDLYYTKDIRDKLWTKTYDVMTCDKQINESLKRHLQEKRSRKVSEHEED